MTDQVVAATTERTVIAARGGEHALTQLVRGPGAAGAAPSRASRQRTGRRGEDLAATYLEDIGWQVLERNWRPEHGLRGELDIIALEPAHARREPSSAPVGAPGEAWPGPRLVIVEVKTRSSLRQGPPAAAVDTRKLARLRALAAAWATTHETPPHTGMRLDVVSILLRDARPALLRHHRAVDASWG
ncbi:YraN family protein [Actinomyces oris]|uniref:UPF0102 protein BKH29_03070 n=1 Tax=Actinomyces oris TaxID=544580 RepID=A0A1Q8VBU8_9ACTO|nr:YraN family protein [Actinomyces oris]OLO45569.1 endonuclease [Actinomyces oris]